MRKDINFWARETVVAVGEGAKRFIPCRIKQGREQDTSSGLVEERKLLYTLVKISP